MGYGDFLCLAAFDYPRPSILLEATHLEDGCGPDLVSIGPVHLPGGFEVTCLRPAVALQTRLSLGQDNPMSLRLFCSVQSFSCELKHEL